LQPILDNRVDAHGRVALTMTLLALVLFAALEFEYDDFVSASMLDYGRFDFLIEQRRAYVHIRAVGDGQGVEFDDLTNLFGQTGNTHNLTLGDGELLSTGSDDCVSHGLYYLQKYSFSLIAVKFQIIDTCLVISQFLIANRLRGCGCLHRLFLPQA